MDNVEMTVAEFAKKIRDCAIPTPDIDDGVLEQIAELTLLLTEKGRKTVPRNARGYWMNAAHHVLSIVEHYRKHKEVAIVYGTESYQIMKKVTLAGELARRAKEVGDVINS
jgi:hypothetical protein